MNQDVRKHAKVKDKLKMKNKDGDMSKGHRKQYEWAPTGQIWDYLASK